MRVSIENSDLPLPDPGGLSRYLDTALEALTIVAADDFAAASSTTIVIFIPPWPRPQ